MVTKVKDSIWGVLILALTIANYATPAKGIGCHESVIRLFPCQGYLMGHHGISIPCCIGVASLKDIAAASQEDRRVICQCLKAVGQHFGISPDRARGLPQLCNLNVNFTIDANIDCTTI